MRLSVLPQMCLVLSSGGSPVESACSREVLLDPLILVRIDWLTSTPETGQSGLQGQDSQIEFM